MFTPAAGPELAISAYRACLVMTSRVRERALPPGSRTDSLRVETEKNTRLTWDFPLRQTKKCRAKLTHQSLMD